jgi:hypothetical protein
LLNGVAKLNKLNSIILLEVGHSVTAVGGSRDAALKAFMGLWNCCGRSDAGSWRGRQLSLAPSVIIVCDDNEQQQQQQQQLQQQQQQQQQQQLGGGTHMSDVCCHNFSL